MKVSAIMHDSFDLTVFRSSFVVHRDGLTSTCNMPPWIHEGSGTLRQWDSEIPRGNLESLGTVVEE